MPEPPLAARIYRLLLRLYPAGFRESYGRAMECEFADDLAEVSGPWSFAGLWIRILADLAVSIPAQVAGEVAQDVRHTARLWAARPWHTGFAMAALAIGIGASTGVFSIVNALLLRSLPFHEPERLGASMEYFIPPHATAREFHEWRGKSAYLADAALVEEFDVNLGGVRDPGRAHAAQASWNFFSALGVRPVLGRGFAEGEDTAGRNEIVVIGYGLWQQHFGGDPRVLGAAIRIDGKRHAIVGVAPAGFNYPGHTVLWKPAVFTEGNNGWATVVRLKPGVSWAQARAAFAAEPKPFPGPLPELMPLQDKVAGTAKNASLLLLAGVGLLLLIACTNVANLVMARMADRAVELSIRSALGASRARLAQQLLTECLLLSVGAAVAGMGIAFWTGVLAEKVQPPPLETQSYSMLDGRVLGFAVLLAVASSVLFGVLPSMYAGRAHVFGSRGTVSARGGRRIRDGLVAAQVALTIVLLTASIAVGRAFADLMGVDRGYEVKGLVTVNVSLEGTTYQENKRQSAYFEEALTRVRRLPGVRSASATEFLPLYATGFLGGPFGLDGRKAERTSTMVPVLGRYFETMGGRILYGRELTDAEVRTRARVAVVNERFAGGFGIPAEVVGRQLTIGRITPWKIVGVVQGMDYETDLSLAKSNQVFVPAESPGRFFSTIVARVDGRANERLGMIRDAVRSVDATVPVFGAKTMEQRLDEIFARPKFYRTAVWIFTAFALLLAVTGIYGIVSYAVVERRREMGVRMALGLTAVEARGMLLWQGLLTVGAGALPGMAGAMLSGRYLESLIAGAKPAGLDVLALPLPAVFLAAAVSIWLGTRRIARIDVMAILRSE